MKTDTIDLIGRIPASDKSVSEMGRAMVEVALRQSGQTTTP